MKQILLSALFIASVFSKGPCDQKLECYKKTFESDNRALCLGFKGCARAAFGTTDYNPICSGAESCAASKVTDAPENMMCNGFKSCFEMRRGIKATAKIACNGLKSCNDVVGSIKAPTVKCDGDIACINQKLVATGTPPVGSINDITCNGNKACASIKGGQANLISDGTINCDGDCSCKDARLEANQIACGGKRGCYGGNLEGPAVVYAYGFNAAANSVIKAPEQGKKSKKKWTFDVRGLGFNSLLGAVINSGGARLTVDALGYRSLVGGRVKCMGGSVCNVNCKMNACKGADIFVDKRATLIISPAGCDPRDPNFKTSKKDPSLPAKQLGIHCPTIRGPGLKQPLPPVDADIDIIENVEFGIDEQADEVDAAWFASTDYLEMVEQAQQAEAALDAMINERVALYEDNLDLSLPEETEEDLMVVGHMISNNKSNILTSNLLIALIVFIMTSVGSLCYIAYRFGGSAETKALLS